MRYSEGLKNKALEYYSVGYLAQKISEILGPNEATIRVWLKSNKIEIRDGGSYNVKHSEDVVKEIWQLYEEGYNTIGISDMLNLKR